MKANTDTKPFKALTKKEVNVMVPPAITAMMTGAKTASQDLTGDITLHYTDGSKETAHFLTDAPELCSFENFFAVVELVQRIARH